MKPVPGIQIVGVTRLLRMAALENSPPSAKKEKQITKKKSKKKNRAGDLTPPQKKNPAQARAVEKNHAS